MFQIAWSIFLSTYLAAHESVELPVITAKKSSAHALRRECDFLLLEQNEGMRKEAFRKEQERKREFEARLWEKRNFDLQRSLQNPALLSSAVRQSSLLAHVINVSAPGHLTTGDFYRAFVLPDGRVSIFIGDLVGHGAEAAKRSLKLHALMTRLEWDQRFINAHSSAGEVLTFIDREIIRSSALELSPANYFDKTNNEEPALLLSNLIFDPKTGELQRSNAGLPKVIVKRSDGSIVYLKASGTFVGYVSDFFDLAHEGTESIVLEKGDLVFLMTDGLNEATNSSGLVLDDYKSNDLITKAITRLKTQNVEDAAKAIFSEATHIGDDLTLIVLSRK